MENNDENLWIIDQGASTHITKSSKGIRNLTKDDNSIIKDSNGNELKNNGNGEYEGN